VSYPNEDRSSDNYTGGGISPTGAGIDVPAFRATLSLGTGNTAEFAGLYLTGSGFGAQTIAQIACSAALQVGLEVSTNFASNIAFSVHLTATGQTGLSIDGGSAGANCAGLYIYMDEAVLVAADSGFTERFAIWGSDGSLRFTPNGFRGDVNRINLTGPVATGTRDAVLPDHSGTIVLATIKTTTGDPTAPAGNVPMVVVNTFDNTVKIYADGAWRTIASGW
jgi:hypothetical protein